MTQSLFNQTKILFLVLATLTIFASCESNDNDSSSNLKGQIKFLDENEDAVSSNWGVYNAEGEIFSLGILVTNPENVHLSAVYPESNIRTAQFENELRYTKNPIDFIASTPIPYIATLPEGAGINEYNSEYQKLLVSDNFDPILKNKGIKNIFGSYHIEKYEQIKDEFFGRSDIGKLFIKTAYNNTSKLGKIKGRKFLRSIREFYSIYTSTPEALFKEDKYNHPEYYEKGESPLHAKYITYGRLVWAILESEYSNQELNFAMSKAEEYNFDPIKIEADSYLSKIFERTAITVMSLGNSDKLFCQEVTIDELGKQLSTNYPKGTPFGQPIFIKWRYIHNDSDLHDIE